MLLLSIGDVRVPARQGRVVHRREDDDLTAHLLGAQIAREVEQRDRPVVFVAVIGASKKRRQSFAALYRGNRNHDVAPRRVVPAVGRLEVAMLNTVSVEIDRCDNG
jgi:hypothetical protein